MRSWIEQPLMPALAVLVCVALPVPAADYLDSVAGTSHLLQSEAVTCAIHMQSGHLKGLYDNEAGQRFVAESYDTYYLRTEDGSEAKASEKNDLIRNAEVDAGNSVLLECTNAALPEATIWKHYFFAEVDGEKRVVRRQLAVVGRPKRPTLFSSVSNTVFDADFREDAWYHYVVPQGVVGNQHPLMHASQVRRPIARRDHHTDDVGRAACDAWNPTVGAGFAQYLYMIDDKWVYPRALGKQTYWTASGWQMGSGGFFISETPHTVETRYHLFFEDRLQVHYEYMDSPEFRALRKATKPLPVLSQVVSPGTGGEFVRPGDHTIAFWGLNPAAGMDGQFQWGIFAEGDGVVLNEMSYQHPGTVQLTVTARSLKERFAKDRAENPNSLKGLYLYRNCDSPVARAHPDWFYKADRKRGIVYTRRIPEVDDFLARGIAREADYLGAGLYYVDGAIEGGAVDWERQQVYQSDAELYAWKRLYDELHSRGKLLWTNMRTGSVFYDVAYYEGSGAQVAPGKTWRDGADMDLMNKLHQIPGTMHIPLYWWMNTSRENNRRYQNLCLGLALSPRGGPWAQEIDGKWPPLPNEHAFSAAVDEYRNARFVRIGLDPAWWRDLETNVEAYTLRLGETYLVNAINHANGVEDVTVSVDLKRMGWGRDAPVYVWQQQARPALTAGSQYADDQVARLYVERGFSKVQPDGARLKLRLRQMPPHRIRVCTLSRVPAFVYSADGIQTQNLLPETLGCSISGSVDEAAKTVSLKVQASRPIEVLAWWPKAWGEGRVTVAGKLVESRPVAVGGADWLVFALPEGNWDVTLG